VAAPVGFTNSAQVKEEFLKCRVPSVVVRGTYGGSGVAAALFNELVKIAHGR
jgi:precorrin-8X/cobalt-precorrin-8 methylmutase